MLPVCSLILVATEASQLNPHRYAHCLVESPMRRPIDVLIYVHHPQRELDTAALLSVLLKRDHGLTAEIASHLYDDYEVIRKLSPKVVALPWYYRPTKGFQKMKRYFPTASFVNLAWEQLFSKVSAGRKHVEGEIALNEMIFLAWGEEFRRFLLADGVKDENIRIVGNPACGLLIEPYIRKFADRASLAKQHGLDPGARWLFLPENWRAGYMPPKQYAMYDKGGHEGRGQRFHEWSKTSMEACCRWMREAPGRTEIILRPRPFIEPDKFAAFVKPWLEGAKKVHIIPDGTVREWVAASNAVMSSLSSTLLEAASAGKPAYVLAPLSVPSDFTTEWIEMCRRISSQEQFNSDLCLSSQLERSLDLEEWVQRTLMVTKDPLASMAQALADSVRASVSSNPERPGEVGLALSAGVKNTRDLLKQALRGHKEKISRKDAFSQAEVDALSVEWAAVLEEAKARN